MKEHELFDTNTPLEDEMCECVRQCTCGKASDIFNDYAEGYFLPTKILTLKSDENLDEDNMIFEEDNIIFEEDFDDFNEDCEEISLAKVLPVITPEQIEQRKSELRGTQYFSNEFAITKCHLVIVEVAFKNDKTEDILGYVKTASEGNFEILELRDYYVKYIAHYDSGVFAEEDILDYLHEVFGHEFYSIVYVTSL